MILNSEIEESGINISSQIENLETRESQMRESPMREQVEETQAGETQAKKSKTLNRIYKSAKVTRGEYRCRYPFSCNNVPKLRVSCMQSSFYF